MEPPRRKKFSREQLLVIILVLGILNIGIDALIRHWTSVIFNVLFYVLVFIAVPMTTKDSN